MFVIRTATISAGGSLSNAIDSSELTLVAVQMPSDWTAASMTFVAVGYDNVDRVVTDKAGTEVALTVSAGKYVLVSELGIAGSKQLKVRSGTSSAPVNQVQQRDVVLIFALV